MQNLLSYFGHYVKVDMAEMWFQNTTFHLYSCDLLT
jgi:hypothetical protein